MLSPEGRVADRSYWLLALKPSISKGAVAASWGGKLLSRHLNVTRDEFRRMCTIAHSLRGRFVTSGWNLSAMGTEVALRATGLINGFFTPMIQFVLRIRPLWKP